MLCTTACLLWCSDSPYIHLCAARLTGSLRKSRQGCCRQGCCTDTAAVQTGLLYRRTDSAVSAVHKVQQPMGAVRHAYVYQQNHQPNEKLQNKECRQAREVAAHSDSMMCGVSGGSRLASSSRVESRGSLVTSMSLRLQWFSSTA